MIPMNINDQIEIRLTETGKQELIKNHKFFVDSTFSWPLNRKNQFFI